VARVRADTRRVAHRPTVPVDPPSPGIFAGGPYGVLATLGVTVRRRPVNVPAERSATGGAGEGQLPFTNWIRTPRTQS